MIRPTLDLDGPIAKAMTDEQLIEPVYGSTHQIVNRDKFNASPRAAKVRALAEAAGRVQPSRERRVESLRQVMTMHPPEKPLTAEQIKGREIFSEAKCRELLNGDGGGKLKSVDPESYKLMQAASQSYGLLAEGSFVHVSATARGHRSPEPAPAPAPAAPAPEPPKTLEGEHTVSEWVDHFSKAK